MSASAPAASPVDGASLPPLVEPAPELTREELERYSRHLTLPQVGSEGQRRLKNARVLVIGAGGLGSPALQYLAAAGVGTIGVVDDDHVSVSNLQRQVVHTTADIGRPKTASAAEAVARLNPLVTVVPHQFRLSADTALDLVRDYDLVLDGADNFTTRYLVSDACALAGIPCVWGSILRFEGRVSVFWSGRGPTYRDLHPEPPPPGEVPSCAEGGVLGMLPATIGAVMVTEAVKLITGTGRPLLGRLLLHDALAMTWRELGVMADPDAPPVTAVADPDAAWAQAQSAGAAGAAGSAAGGDAEPAAHETVSAAQLAGLLEQREQGLASFVLIDVRDDWERQLVRIPGAVAVHLDDIVARGGDALPPQARGTSLILHCKAGARSATALQALRPHFAMREETLRHVGGGILEWIRGIDPSLPEY